MATGTMTAGTEPASEDSTPSIHHPVRGAVAGVVAAGLALGAAELLAGTFRRLTSPVVSIGDQVVDRAPSWLKTFAIDTFGTNDKPALIIGTLVILAAAAAAIGVLADRRRTLGWIGVGLFGLVGAIAAVTNVGGELVDAAPAVVGAGVAAVALDTLLYRLGRPDRSGAHRDGPAGVLATDRRRFLAGAAATATLAAASGGLGRALKRRFDVAAARAGLVLPRPADPAAALPAGVDPPVDGLSSYVTSNADFYRIDTALVVPQVDPQTWKLTIGGMVDNELSFTLDDLLKRPLVERVLTLACVSNEVGGGLVGNARWLGVPLADLLEEAGVSPDADQLVSRSVDGFTAGSPVSVIMDGRDALLAVGMNGEPLPTTHGFPARLVVPGLYGFVSATKWVTELELTRFDAFDAYWVRRGWAERAPVKTMSRIDTPRGLQKLSPGTVPLAGVAWAPHRGIEAVEVQIDDGAWQTAELAPVTSADTWRQWVYRWDAAPGRHSITVRATDGTGETQTEDRVAPIPDGASGWHQIVVTVG
jgi:DMSO/TMAO reductase YedYZ molybdopterin-dependent catalytic subunit